MTMSTATEFTLVGDRSLRLDEGPHFGEGTRVYVGGVEAAVVNVTGNGSLLTAVSPSYAALCGNGSSVGPSGCGSGRYFEVSVVNDAWLGGGEMSCPPSCPPDEEEMPSGSAGGFFYVESCVGYDVGPVCISAPESSTCAFGSGDSCMACPSNAVCPGGERMWPLPGYWVASEEGPLLTW